MLRKLWYNRYWIPLVGLVGMFCGDDVNPKFWISKRHFFGCAIVQGLSLGLIGAYLVDSVLRK